MSNTNRGFTLIELLVVIGIIGILSGILYVVIDPQAQRNKAKDAVIKETMRKIYLEINSFYSTNLTYPSIAQLPMLLGSNVDIGNRGRTNCLHFEGIETSYGSTTCDTDTTKRFFYNYGYTPPCISTRGFSKGTNGNVKFYAIKDAKIKSSDVSGMQMSTICAEFDSTDPTIMAKYISED